MTTQQLLDTIAQQQRDLVFPAFSNEDAYRLGQAMKQAAEQAGHKLVISIKKGSELVFFCAMDGIKPINRRWLARKIAAAETFHTCSYSVGLQQQLSGSTFVDSGLNAARYAGAGGCFPIVLQGFGFAGVAAVSGLDQAHDHQFVADAISAHLSTPTVSILE